MAKKTTTIICEVKVPFEDYGSIAANKRAVAAIKRELKQALKYHCSYIEMSKVTKDQYGSWNLDCSGRTTIKVKDV